MKMTAINGTAIRSYRIGQAGRRRKASLSVPEDASPWAGSVAGLRTSLSDRSTPSGRRRPEPVGPRVSAPAPACRGYAYSPATPFVPSTSNGYTGRTWPGAPTAADGAVPSPGIVASFLPIRGQSVSTGRSSVVETVWTKPLVVSTRKRTCSESENGSGSSGSDRSVVPTASVVHVRPRSVLAWIAYREPPPPAPAVAVAGSSQVSTVSSVGSPSPSFASARGMLRSTRMFSTPAGGPPGPDEAVGWPARQGPGA